MPNYREWINERERLVNDLQSGLNGRVRSLQDRLYRQLVRLTAELETDNLGRVRRTNSIPGIQRKINRVFEKYVVNVKRGIIPWMVKGVLRLLGVNTNYFKSFNRFDFKTVRNVAAKRYLQQLGFNADTGTVKTGSWLDGLSSSLDTKIGVMQRFSNAILSGISLKLFSNLFEKDFISGSGLNLQNHWQTHTRTLFMSLDRSMQTYYAQELKLTYYLYSGTIKNNTRDFCKHRVGRVYTEDEVRSWQNQNWKGKIPGADIFTALGGYNCRHSLNAISEQIAKRLAKTRGGVNSYA